MVPAIGARTSSRAEVVSRPADWRARCRRPGAPARAARRACLPAVRAGRLRLRAGWPRRHRRPPIAGRLPICSPGCAPRGPATGRVRARRRHAARGRRRGAQRAARMVVARGPFLSSSTRASASASCARAASSSAADSARSCTTMTSPAFTVAPSANGSETMASFASATSSTRSRSSVPGRVLSSWRAQAASSSDACERGEGAQRHAANSKRMDRSTACTCLVMPPMEM